MKKQNSYYTDIIKLINFRLIVFISISAITGYIIINNKPDIDLFYLVLGIFFLSIGASTLNHYYEKEYFNKTYDVKSNKSVNKTTTLSNYIYIPVLMIISGCILLSLLGYIPVLLAVLYVLLYNVAYLKLKQRTIFAIVPGAIAMAVPPIMGWTAVGGYIFYHSILYLAGILVIWQIPQLLLLMLKLKHEYQSAGFKNILNYMDETNAKFLIIIWIALSSFSLLYISFTEIYLNYISKLVLIGFIVLNNTLIYSTLIISKNKNNYSHALFILNSLILVLLILIIISNIL